MAQSGIIYPASSSSDPLTKQSIIETLGYAPAAGNFSFPEKHNPEFIVKASVIVAPSNSFSHGQPITWQTLAQNTSHGSSFFTGVSGQVNARLRIEYPLVRYAFFCNAHLDETFGPQLVTVGPTVGLSNAEFAVSTPRNVGMRLVGAGSTTWTKNGDSSAFDVGSFSTADGGTSLNIQTPALISDPNVYNRLTAVYHGPNGYTISRIFSGLGSFNYRFVLRKPDLTFLNTNPTTSDMVIIQGATQPLTIGMQLWNSTTNSWMTTGTNFFIDGMFEAWMIAGASSTTSIVVRWQTDYPSATNYKIYRDTSSTFATEVLIHTGTEGKFVDTGLTANTLYHYKMVAVIGGVDTTITTFRCATPAS